MRHFFVINPHSFRMSNSLQQLLMDIDKCFSGNRKADYRIYFSRYPRDAVAAVHRYITAAPQSDTVRIYAVGGDGTLFDCLNGMSGFENAELTAVPYGSSNDFVRAFGESAAEKFRVIENLCTGSPKPVDVIKCGSNCALNEVAFGVESQAIINANYMFRNPRYKLLRKHPSLVYNIGAVVAILNEEIRFQQYNVIVDGEDMSGCYCNISVSNSGCIGGSMISNPYSQPNDGLLNAIFAKGGNSAMGAMKLITAFTNGHFEKNADFSHKKFHKMELRSDLPIRVHMDGESFYSDEINLEIIPGYIKFVAPDGLDFADYSHRAYQSANKTKKEETQ